MSRAGSGRPAAPAALAGIAAGAGWYGAAQVLVAAPAAPLVAAIGGIVLAGAGSAWLARREARRAGQDDGLSAMRKMQAFEAHSVVSMVDTDGRLKDVNDLMLELTGYDRADLIGQPVEMLYDTEDKTLAAQVRTEVLQGRTWHGETRLRHADGHRIYTQTTVMPLTGRDGAVAGSISVRTDTTHINQLRADHHTMEALNELRDDIWIMNADQWRITYMNHAAHRRAGCENGALPSETLDMFAANSGLEEIVRACRTLRDERDTAVRFEMTHRDVPLHVSIKQLSEPGGDTRFLIMMSDVSDRVAQDRRKSEFIATVSHELRAPMTSIKGALRLLLGSKDMNLPDKALALLEIAHRSSDRLILIVNDILDLDKIATGEMQMQMQPSDASALVRETLSATQILQEASGVSVEVIGAEEPLPLMTDPNRFIQVLTNLLSNACKFSPRGGRVTIEIEDEIDHLRVAVKDEGAGIPAADRYKIFQRFADMTNSDRAAKGGTGLGLSICKAIVESMDGTIGFQTREGAGTIFYFTLPKALAIPIDTAKIGAAPDPR